MFYHVEKGVRFVVHSDNLSALGTEEALDWSGERMRESYILRGMGR